MMKKHVISILITLTLFACSLLFFFNSYYRIWESLKDIGTSFLSFLGLPVDSSVNDMPKGVSNNIIDFIKDKLNKGGSGGSSSGSSNVPGTALEIKSKFVRYFELLIDKDNLFSYLRVQSKILKFLLKNSILIIPLIYCAKLLFMRSLLKENDNVGKETIPLRFCKFLSKNILKPCTTAIKNYITFLNEYVVYRIIWLLLFLLCFNFFTLFLEYIAFTFYLSSKGNFLTLWIQLQKLLIDLKVFIKHPFMSITFFAVLYHYLRENLALRKLYSLEERNKSVIEEQPIVVLICGTMGKKKTTLLTDMTLSQEVIFRDKALEKLFENNSKFPKFDFIKFEKTITNSLRKGYIYNLASIKTFIKRLQYYFERSFYSNAIKKSIRRQLNKRYGINYNNLLFDYDYEKYGLYHYNGLKQVYIWDVLNTYAQLYYIYTIESSLIVSNYSIRSSNEYLDSGKFPLWYSGLFDDRRYETDKFSHILDFDTFRLGKKFIEENADNLFEFGVTSMTEIGKERGNRIELADKKKIDTGANQKNDLFNSYLKLIRHSSTVDNFPFVKVLTDEQRPESWGADARELAQITHIDGEKKKNAKKVNFLVRTFYESYFDRFQELYYEFRNKRADNCLTMHLLKKIFMSLNNYMIRNNNLYGYFKMKLLVEEGTQDGEFEKKKYYLINRKIYTDRFSTDCYSEFFNDKQRHVHSGLNDIPTYLDVKASVDELKEQNSYFITDLYGRTKDDT